MNIPKYCPVPDECGYSDCPTAFCDHISHKQFNELKQRLAEKDLQLAQFMEEVDGLKQELEVALAYKAGVSRLM